MRTRVSSPVCTQAASESTGTANSGNRKHVKNTIKFIEGHVLILLKKENHDCTIVLVQFYYVHRASSTAFQHYAVGLLFMHRKLMHFLKNA